MLLSRKIVITRLREKPLSCYLFLDYRLKCVRLRRTTRRQHSTVVWIAAHAISFDWCKCASSSMPGGWVSNANLTYTNNYEETVRQPHNSTKHHRHTRLGRCAVVWSADAVVVVRTMEFVYVTFCLTAIQNQNWWKCLQNPPFSRKCCRIRAIFDRIQHINEIKCAKIVNEREKKIDKTTECCANVIVSTLTRRLNWRKIIFCLNYFAKSIKFLCYRMRLDSRV